VNQRHHPEPKPGRGPRRHRAPAPAIAAALLAAVMAGPAAAVTFLKPGSAPPPIALDTLDGNRIGLDDVLGRPVVVVFGEVYHERTLVACGEIREALRADDLRELPVSVMLVVARDAPVSELKRRAEDPRLPATILRDVDRRSYADYRVTVMPSVVVIDTTGRVVHALAGYTARLRDTVADAVRVAAGRISRAQFEAMLHPGPAEPVNESAVRAARIAGLARQLGRRGLDELAEEKYREALELAPDDAPARIGLAMILLKRPDLAGAEREFRAALGAEPAQVEATLGLAYVQTLRGGAELEEARRVVSRLVKDHPEEPRAHYVLGLIHQQLDEPAEAVVFFQRATELLMSRREGWLVVPASRRHDRE
jgi:Flp pilus assembly protein TadD